ncbi:hypothetical protein [Rubrivirga sp. IMCC43871]|uniref:hypothetical protein n=1 Tax=Rubrivirga sp. IMCC43871 TaxID=3391575 RepID=UPI00398FEB05
MTGLTFQTSRPAVVAAPRAPLAAAAAKLSAAEHARIADAFPAKPTVAQRLYGADRSVQAAPALGGRLDLRG